MPEQVDYLIIGGGPAGTKAAESVRQNDPRGRILIVTSEPYPLYDRTKLQGYIKGEKIREDVLIRNKQHYSDQRLELWVGAEVVKINPEEKRATLSDSRELSFRKALIASGGKPCNWEVPGANIAGVMRLHTLDQADEIVKLLPSTKEVLIVGGGFISLDFCGIASAHSKKVTVLVREPYYWAGTLDEISGQLITKLLRKNGIIVRANERVAQVLGANRVTGVKTSKGKIIAAQMIGVGIGIMPNLKFLTGTSIRINSGIVTNEYLESSAKDIWAAGDVAEFRDVASDARHILGHWPNATEQGTYVGRAMALGREDGRPFMAVPSYAITSFNFNVAFVGDINPREAEVIERGDKKSGFGRIFIKDDRVVGATLVARPMDRPPLVELIRQRTPVHANLRAILAHHTRPIPWVKGG